MPGTAMPSGTQQSAAMWRDQRIAQATAPARIRASLMVALDQIDHMDEGDSELRPLALVIFHCTQAVVTALDSRS